MNFKLISSKENAFLPYFEFLPNFSGRNFSSGWKKTWKKCFFFSILEETGEPCTGVYHKIVKIYRLFTNLLKIDLFISISLSSNNLVILMYIKP